MTVRVVTIIVCTFDTIGWLLGDRVFCVAIGPSHGKASMGLPA